MNRNLRLLGLGVAIRMLGNAIYAPFLALFLANVLQLAYVEIGTIIVIVGLIQLPFNFLGGLLTDRWGRRRLILIGLVSEAAATAGLAYSFSIPSLLGAIVAATFGGIVTTTTGPAASAYIADFAEGPERTRGFTFIRIGFNAGYSAGVTMGGLLISFVGFAGSVAVAAAVIGTGALFLALTLDPSPGDRRMGSSVEPPGPSRAVPKLPARSMGASLRILAKDSVALELLLAVLFAAVVVGQWAVTFPLFVHNVLGVSYSLLGLGLALNGLVVVFGQQMTTESVLGRRHTTIAIFGLLLYAAAFLGLGAAGLYAFVPTAVFFVAVIALTFGENLITIPQSTLPSNLAPKEEVGSYNGAFSMVGGAGFLASVFIGGLVLTLVTNPLLIWVILLVPAIPSILLFRHAAGRLSSTVYRA
ncbi:MAG: MFS transporter [Thermoplasmata archaeon]|nr:MFS transporter [Thermoplasmata archaeon]